MTFEYSIYYRQNCIVPLISCLFYGILLIKVGWKFIKYFPIKNCFRYIVDNITKSIFLIFCLFLIVVDSIYLLRGGIYLLTEKESDAIIISGTIEDEMEIGFLTGCKYNTENNHGRGEILIINGEKYHIMSYENLKIGDSVTITVLPRSKFILKICKDTPE